MNTDSCDMVPVPDHESVKSIGDFAIYNDDGRGDPWISMRLPSGGFCTLPLNHSSGWQWDCNLERPTLTPSVFHDPNSGSRFEWHGFIRNGRMESC